MRLRKSGHWRELVEMGGHFDGVVAGNRGQGQRRAFGLGIRRQTLELEFEVPDGPVGRALLWQRQRPIGRRAFDEQVDRRSGRRLNIDEDAIMRVARLTMHAENGERRPVPVGTFRRGNLTGLGALTHRFRACPLPERDR